MKVGGSNVPGPPKTGFPAWFPGRSPLGMWVLWSISIVGVVFFVILGLGMSPQDVGPRPRYMPRLSLGARRPAHLQLVTSVWSR